MEYPKKIKALVDFPNSGNVRKGEIGIYTGYDNVYSFPSQKTYHVTKYYIGNRYKNLDEINYEIY